MCEYNTYYLLSVLTVDIDTYTVDVQKMAKNVLPILHSSIIYLIHACGASIWFLHLFYRLKFCNGDENVTQNN